MVDIEEFPVIVKRAVSWGQMDAFQHLNNVEYFRFFEDARIAYFEEMEIYDPEAIDVFPQIGPILAGTSCKFLAPVTYPDELAIGAKTSEFGDDRFVVEYAIYSDKADRIVAVGDCLVVAYNYAEGHKVEVPKHWRDAIGAIEGLSASTLTVS